MGTNVIEIWKDIPDYEGYYQASSTGLIRSIDRVVKSGKRPLSNFKGKMLRPSFDKDCYLRVCLAKDNLHKMFYVSVIVAITFDIEKHPGAEVVDHINRVRWDNRIENLRWVTQLENVEFSFSAGNRHRDGRSIGQYTLDGKFVKSYKIQEDVKRDGFRPSTVNRVLRGERKTAFGYIWRYEG
jgi:hypothetical protein